MGAVSFNLETPSASLLAGNVGFLTGFEHIQTITVGAGGASSVTFSGIPQYYRHLQIRGVARSSTSGSGADYVYGRINGDTGSNYAWHELAGNGSSAVSGAGTSASFMRLGYAIRTSTAVNSFPALVIDVLDYANTVKNTTVRCLSGSETNDGTYVGYVALRSGLWMSTAAVNSFTLYPEANAFPQYSTFSLYGIR